MEKVIPVYTSLPGWQEDIAEIKQFEKLPENAIQFIKKIETLIKTPISIVSIGADRNQIIFKN